jgi:hypothetical protein
VGEQRQHVLLSCCHCTTVTGDEAKGGGGGGGSPAAEGGSVMPRWWRGRAKLAGERHGCAQSHGPMDSAARVGTGVKRGSSEEDPIHRPCPAAGTAAPLPAPRRAYTHSHAGHRGPGPPTVPDAGLRVAQRPRRPPSDSDGEAQPPGAAASAGLRLRVDRASLGRSPPPDRTVTTIVCWAVESLTVHRPQ